MVTIKAIDVMLQYGEKHYLTVRNVEVRGGGSLRWMMVLF